MSQTLASTVALTATPAIAIGEADTPWVPMAEGQWFRLLRILPAHSGYVAQLKLNPGTIIPPHRHTGAVHALNLQGSRKLHSGEVINAGDYVFEPAGNTDTWQAVGDQPLIVHIQVAGNVEYLDSNGGVVACHNAASMEAAYRRYCESVSCPAKHLGS